MANFSAADVKKLRELTGAGMMDCKRALDESEGDFDKAVEILRIKGAKDIGKRAERTTAEGLVAAAGGALIELDSETDFVAKNEEFVAFARSLAETVGSQNPKDVAALASGKVEERRQALIQKIGENMTIRRFKRLQAKGKLALYLHGVKIGVLVDYEGPEEVGKDVAMHVAFAKPQHATKAEVPADVVAREREIQLARAKESGKPAEIAAKMVEGAVNKFLGEITLMGQPFVKDDKQTVEKMLAAKKGKVNGYAFLVVGEGIEKASPVH